MKNFSGLWKANLEMSYFADPIPAGVTMKIAQEGPILKQAILVTRPSGDQERSVLTYFTNGEESTTELRGLLLRNRVKLQGSDMVIESEYGGSLFRDYWSSSDDGLTLTMEHRDDQLAGQRTVLERIL